LPSSMNFCASVGSIPRSPITKTRCLVRPERLAALGPAATRAERRHEESAGRDQRQARRDAVR
jgi:hypothetical protein